jgi:hypothetical protein
VKGVTLESLAVKTLLFADDLAAAVRDEEDVEALFRFIAAHEEASGAKLSAPKSFITPLGRADVADRVPLKLPPDLRTQAGHLTVPRRARVAPCQRRRSLEAAVWRQLIDNTLHRFGAIPMADMPLATRCRTQSLGFCGF